MEALRDALAVEVEPAAGAELRLALARSSGADARICWQGVPDEDGYLFRAAAVAASFLHRRGAGAPWQECQEILRQRDPLLYEFLNLLHV